MAKIYEALELASKEKFGRQEISVGLYLQDEVYTPPDPSLAQSLENLYQNIAHKLPECKTRVVQFLSSCRGEGASAIAREFARYCALKMKKSTLLLDADNKHTGHFNWFKLKCENDWHSALKKSLSVKETLCQVRNTRLYVSKVTSSDNFTGDLALKGIDSYMDQLAQDFDLVIVDTYPATLTTDNFLLFHKIDGVVLVVEAERVRWQVVKQVKDRIQNQGGNILGVILNKKDYHIPDFIYNQI